jgi:HemY protein
LFYVPARAPPAPTPRLALLSAGALHRDKADAEAAKVVEAALGDLLMEAAPQPEEDALFSLYGQLCPETAGAAQLKAGEAWLARRPKSAACLAMLGQLCARRKLWGKAKGCLEASLALRPSLEAHLALAQLADALGDEAEANRQFRHAALLRGYC